jgi:hypothetical protein
VTNSRIGFKLQVTAMPGFDSLYDWCYQTTWLYSGVPGDSEDQTVMQMHSADALYSVVKSLIHAIWTEANNAQQNMAHRMIQIAKPWMLRKWSRPKLANGPRLFRILKKNAPIVHLEWNENEHAKLQTLMERYTSQGTSGATRVLSWWLAWFSFGIGRH